MNKILRNYQFISGLSSSFESSGLYSEWQYKVSMGREIYLKTFLFLFKFEALFLTL